MRPTIFMIFLTCIVTSIIAQDTLFLTGTCDKLIEYSFEQENANLSIVDVNLQTGAGKQVIDFVGWDRVDILQLLVGDSLIFSIPVGTDANKQYFHWDEGNIIMPYQPTTVASEMYPLTGYARFTYTTSANCSITIRAISNSAENTYWKMYIHCCEDCIVTDPLLVSTDTVLCAGTNFLGRMLELDTVFIDTTLLVDGCPIYTTYTIQVSSNKTEQHRIICDSLVDNEIIIDTLKNINGCDSVITTFLHYPEELRKLTITSIPVCDETTRTSVDVSDEEESSYTFNWSTGDSNATIYIDQEKTHTVTITDQHNCSVILSDLISVFRSPSLELGEDIEIAQGLQIILSPKVVPSQLQEDIQITPYTIDYENWFPAHDQLVYGSIEDENGCEAIDSIFIKVHPRDLIYIPNSFSPNADGVNDFFRLFTQAEISSYEVAIFDRWGSLIYEKGINQPSNDQQTWDGTCRGQLMQQGVFIYWIHSIYTDGYESFFKGNITISP